MPELPELETIRRGLDKEAAGKRIKSADLTGTRLISRHGTKKAFQARVEGAKIKAVDRRGTRLVAPLDTGDVLVVDLGDTTHISRLTPKDPPIKHTLLVLTFTQGGQLRVVDPKPTGEVFVTAADELLDEVPELRSLGVDPVGEPVSWTVFAHKIVGNEKTLRQILLDPTIVVGVGNVYADEICFEAGLRPERQGTSLSAMELRRLFRALVETLHEAVKHHGTTLDENGFTDIYGKPGEYQLLLQVHGRDGEACRRCRGTISKMRLGNRTVWLCESCQV
jgi:formamidopyrimidine-DNA glycosylase